jgi:hypothetical protein
MTIPTLLNQEFQKAEPSTDGRRYPFRGQRDTQPSKEKVHTGMKEAP